MTGAERLAIFLKRYVPPDRGLFCVELIIALTAVGCATYVLVTTIYGITQAYHPIPDYDHWTTVELAEQFRAGKLGLADLFVQHNEHRPVFPRLLFIVDHLLFAGRGVFLLALTGLLHGCHLFLLVAVARRLRVLGWLDAATVWGLVFSLGFWFVQNENLVRPFQVQIILACFAASSAFLLVALAAKTHDSQGSCLKAWLFLGAAVGACFVASFSFANGTITWAVVLAMSIMWRLPTRMLAAVAVLGVTVVGGYFIRYQSPSQHANPFEALFHLTFVLKYLLTYFGGSVQHIGPMAVVAFGATGLASVAMTFVCVVARRRLEPWQAAPVGLIMFVIATAIVTALARASMGVEQALASRYQTLALLLWVALLVLAFGWASTHLKERRWCKVAFQAILLGLAIPIIGTIQKKEVRQAWKTFVRCDEAALALVVGVNDQRAKRLVFPVPDRLTEKAAILQKRQSSVFSEEWTNWLGQSIDNFTSAGSSDCIGGFETLEPVDSKEQPGAFVSGWGWDNTRSRELPLVLLADDRGTIVGLGRSRRRRRDVARVFGMRKMRNAGWSGYVQGHQRHEQLRAYGLCSDERFVSILPDVASTVLPAQSVRLETVVPTRVERCDSEWTRDGYYPKARQPPGGGPAFGSWSGSDANKGNLTLELTLAQESVSYYVPVITGPSSQGLTLRVLDKNSGDMLSWLPLGRPLVEWHLWQLPPFPAGPDRSVLLVAEDRGSKWGQWLAIGPVWTSRVRPSLEDQIDKEHSQDRR